MATCIVCDAYINEEENEEWCQRCCTHNRGWQRWQEIDRIERGGLDGLLAFTEPHFYLPFIVTALSTIFGLLGVFTLWLDVKPGFRLLALLLTPVGCLLSLQGIYEARMQIRKSELLRQVKRGWGKKGTSAQTLTLVVPAVAAGFTLFLTFALIYIEPLWELVKWLALVDPPETGSSLPEKFLAVLPFVSMIGYVMFAISFTASSSLMLARFYINRMNRLLPRPIFLQSQKLAMVVRREAEIELGRQDPLVCQDPEHEGSPSNNPTGENRSMMGYIEQTSQQHLLLAASADMSVTEVPQLPSRIQLWCQTANWVWDELVRTDDGSIEMRVARDEIYKLPKPSNSGYIPNPRVRYTVRANPWGHITEIKRDAAK